MEPCIERSILKQAGHGFVAKPVIALAMVLLLRNQVPSKVAPTFRKHILSVDCDAVSDKVSPRLVVLEEWKNREALIAKLAHIDLPCPLSDWKTSLEYGSQQIPILEPSADMFDDEKEAEVFDEGRGPAPSFWRLLWPGGIALSEHIFNSSDLVIGKTVLELGAGLAIPSIVSAMLGAKIVFATDYRDDACAFVVANAAFNNVSDVVKTLRLDWESPDIGHEKFELVLAADVLYDEDAPALIAGVLYDVVAAGGFVLITESFNSLYRSDRWAELLELLEDEFIVVAENQTVIDMADDLWPVETRTLQRLDLT